jgi:gamma-glutamyl hercynylcysteine S-oxide synthase
MHPTATESLPTSRATILERLGKVRARTLSLVESLSEDALNRVHDPLMSPVVWDLGHMATFEDLWLAQNAFGAPPLRAGLDRVYDPFTAARSERGELPYLRSEDCLGYMEAVRARTLELLAEADLTPDAGPLLSGGFVYELILRHEMQHSETILQTLQIMTAEVYAPRPVYAWPTPAAGRQKDMVLVPGGPFEMGALAALEHGVFAYDNELQRHERELPAFLIDVAPVTNGEFAAFVQDGGYDRPDLWSPAGWQWREQKRRALPRYWSRDGDGFVVRRFAEVEPLDPEQPVCHVSWFEADAFARHAGKRLPSEAEWEKAASWDAAAQAKRTYPWGESASTPSLANLDQLAFGTAPAGAYPDGASASGALQMLGDVWEWTADGFEAYPGFEAFPYREYSEEFFGGPYRVLRGGSWATQPEAVTNTFRNWDYPERRQIFAGLRCARDAE